MLVEVRNAEITGNLVAENSLQIEIGNPEIVMNILADKLYNDKARIVLQEYACNARDAHREAGIPDTPIEIDLPGMLEPTLKIRDFGPGMSPDRVENVFRLLGNSTKRADNTQTGGFGIGAKCGYAYHTRTFTVVTVHQGIQYTYYCYRAGTGRFMIDLLAQEPTERRSGTEIQIPVDAADYQRFRTYAEWMFEDWSVRPTFNLTIPSQVEDSLVSADGRWVFRKSATRLSMVVASVDGIPYDTGKRYANRRFDNQTLVLRFNPGELTLAANRESIEHTNDNDALITARLDSALSELRAQMNAKYFDPNTPLFSQLSASLFRTLVDLGMVELPSDLPWPPPYDDMNVDSFTCRVQRGCSYTTRKLRGWSPGLDRRHTDNDDRTIIFSKTTPISAIQKYLRTNGTVVCRYFVFRLRDDSNCSLLQRYHSLNDVIDLPTPKAERDPQPKGRVTVGVFEGGRYVNRRLFPDALKNYYWVPPEDPRNPGVPVLLPDGTYARLPRGTYLWVSDRLSAVPQLRYTAVVPDRLKKHTAGPVRLTQEDIDKLRQMHHDYEVSSAMRRIMKKAVPRMIREDALTALLRHYSPEIADTVDLNRARSSSDISPELLKLFERQPLPNLSRAARAVYRIAKLLENNEAVRQAFYTYPDGRRVSKEWLELTSLLYNTYFKKALEAP